MRGRVASQARVTRQWWLERLSVITAIAPASSTLHQPRRGQSRETT
jgi:hypothetical protein